MNKAKDRKRAELIFDEWKASLANRDRSHSSLLDNFDDLFSSMFYSAVEFEVAEEFLKEAIIAHLPSKSTVRFTYKRRKGNGLSESEFFDEWKRLIEDRAKQAFYHNYPIVSEAEEPEEVSGGMTKEEYIRTRRYADSFPRLDLRKIREEMEKASAQSDLDFSIEDLGD